MFLSLFSCMTQAYQGKPSYYVVAVYTNATVSYSILCETLVYQDPSTTRNTTIARDALHKSLQSRMFDSDIKRLQSKHYKSLVARPHSATPVRDGCKGFGGVLAPHERDLLEAAIGDEKEIGRLESTWGSAKPFSLSTRVFRPPMALIPHLYPHLYSICKLLPHLSKRQRLPVFSCNIDALAVPCYFNLKDAA
jgi:hypothetical protein